MKVSKLFHWLYASVMLLPILAIGFKCLYVTFNPNAKDSYFGSTINQTYNEYLISTQTDDDTYYFLKVSDLDYGTASGGNIFVHDLSIFSLGNLSQNTANTINEHVSDIYRLYFSTYNSIAVLEIYYDNNGTLSYLTAINSTFSVIFKFKINSIDGTKYSYIYELKYNNDSYLDNVLYYSVDQINDMDLFNWAKDSFIVAPYRYIGNLFGLQQDSPIYTLLSYWTNVSVIWLVFDLIMYVPLLAHRWLDKGGIE